MRYAQWKSWNFLVAVVWLYVNVNSQAKTFNVVTFILGGIVTNRNGAFRSFQYSLKKPYKVQEMQSQILRIKVLKTETRFNSHLHAKQLGEGRWLTIGKKLKDGPQEGIPQCSKRNERENPQSGLSLTRNSPQSW